MNSYEIIKDKPPIWDKLKKKFPGANENEVAVTYGNKIYCKSEMTDDLLAHELVHVGQQKEIGRDIWWDNYFNNSRFVYAQELEAYREQLKFLRKKYKDRNKQHFYRMAIARILSGPLYNNVKSFDEVFNDLKI